MNEELIAITEQEKSIRLPIAILAPDPCNPRRIDDAAIAGLKTSLETFGPLDICFNDSSGELVSGCALIPILSTAGYTSSAGMWPASAKTAARKRSSCALITPTSSPCACGARTARSE